jgi:hypothetical protein
VKRDLLPRRDLLLKPSQEWARPYIDEMIREKVITSDRDGVLGIHQEIQTNRSRINYSHHKRNNNFSKKHIRSLGKD